MAISVANDFGESTSGSALTGWTTTATPQVSAGKLTLVSVALQSDSGAWTGSPTLSGAGADSWTLQSTSVAFDSRIQFLFSSVTASPGAAASLVFTPPASETFDTATIQMNTVTGSTTSGTNGTDAFVQIKTGFQDAQVSAITTITYDSAFTAGNGGFASFSMHAFNASSTPRSGWTELAESGATLGVVAHWRADSDTIASADYGAEQGYVRVAIAAEIEAAAAGGGSTGTWQVFPSARAYLDDSTILIGSHTFKARLLSSSYTTDPTDTVLADTTGALGTDQTVTLSTSGGTVSIASDVVWTGALANVRHILLYDDTPTDPADPLLAIVDLGANQSVPTSTTFTLPAGDVYFR